MMTTTTTEWSCHLNFALKLDEAKSKHVVFSPEFCTEIGWRKIKTCGLVTSILHWNWMKKSQNMWSCHLNFALKLDEAKSKHVVLSPEFCTEIGWRKIKTCGLLTSILHWNWMKKNQNIVVLSPQFCTEIGWRKVKTCDLVTWILDWNWMKKTQNMWSSHLNFALKLDEEKSKHVILSPEFCTEIGWRKVKTSGFGSVKMVLTQNLSLVHCARRLVKGTAKPNAFCWLIG
jgi:hypothetical protein